MDRKRIVFLTGTRADFGKLKSLMAITQNSNNFEVHIFATGMHMNSKYGKTVNEIVKSKFKNIYKFINHDNLNTMDRTLSNTINGFSHYVAEIQPNLIVIHGDRVEALAGAIVGSLNNILVAHIEGGEVSGTIDELIRHSTSKMSHTHFVSNNDAKKRLVQMGELEEYIYEIGSPDLDIMLSDKLPTLDDVCNYYDLPFKDYAILLFHPVTTEVDELYEQASKVVDAVNKSDKNYIVIYPNNDLGSDIILHEYKNLNKKCKVFSSIRFEFFLVLLKNAEFVIGNSSAGIREAPYYNVPTINIGSRQKNRFSGDTIINCQFDVDSVLQEIQNVEYLPVENGKYSEFGSGSSNTKFLEILERESFWECNRQKQFVSKF